VEPGESNQGASRLSLAGPDTVNDATLAARDFAVRSGLGQAEGARLAIIVEELVANLYDHGGLNDEDPVEIELSAGTDSVCLVITAAGAPFHPGLPLPEADIPSRGGGAGLKFVQAWTLSIDHQQVDGRNRWAVVMPIDPRR
jgi:serine/threonine-protein kinase RsbW